MGSIYPKFTGTKWWRLGYDSYDLDKNIRPAFMDIYKWLVRCGKKRCIVYAKTLDEAQVKACALRNWHIEDLTETRALIVHI